MATASQIQELQNIVGQINGLNRDTLIKREKWGEISFEKSKGQFSQIFWFSDQIKSYPLDTLPDSVANTMLQSLNDTYSKLKAIDNFSINQGNPSGTSAQLSQELHTSVDRLFLNCAQWHLLREQKKPNKSLKAPEHIAQESGTRSKKSSRKLVMHLLALEPLSLPKTFRKNQ